MKKIFIGLVVFIFLCAILFFAWKVVNHDQSSTQSIAPRGGKAMEVSIECPLYLQADKRWHEHELGDSGDKMASYGCTVCSAAMALVGYGQDITPDRLSQQLHSNAGFTENGLLIWSALAKVAGPDYSIVVKNTFDHQYLDQCLEAGNPVITKVLYKGAIWHWVLIVGKQGSDYMILDPLDPSGVVAAKKEYRDGFYTIRHLQKRES